MSIDAMIFLSIIFDGCSELADPGVVPGPLILKTSKGFVGKRQFT